MDYHSMRLLIGIIIGVTIIILVILFIIYRTKYQRILTEQIYHSLDGKELSGPEIVDSLKATYGITIFIGNVYTRLHHLEKEGYVSSRYGEATPKRGGNRKRLYRQTGNRFSDFSFSTKLELAFSR